MYHKLFCDNLLVNFVYRPTNVKGQKNAKKDNQSCILSVPNIICSIYRPRPTLRGGDILFTSLDIG